MLPSLVVWGSVPGSGDTQAGDYISHFSPVTIGQHLAKAHKEKLTLIYSLKRDDKTL